MKIKNTLGIVLMSATMLFSNACSEDALLDLNTDKNSATDIDMAYLFSLGTLRIGAEYENTRVSMLYAATMIQQIGSTASYFSGDRYLYNAAYSGSYMESHYTGIMRLFQQVISETADDPMMVNFNAATTVMKIFDMQRMTDIYGDVPYFQAGKGIEGQENWFPAYDNQADIYASMIDELRAARDKFSESARPLGVQDFVYSGDLDKWRKFSNSLLMRIAMRMSNVNATKAQEVFVEANTNGAFTSNDDIAFIHYAPGPQGVNRNGLNDGYWNNNKYGRDCKVSATFIDWMKENNDPRLMIISGGTGDPDDPSTWNTDPAVQKGLPNGYNSTTIKSVISQADGLDYDIRGNKIFSMQNLKYFDWEDPYYLQSYAEVELMRAEAAVKGWITTSANDHFSNGVTAAINAWTEFDASFARSSDLISAYVAGRGFVTASDEDKLRLIGEEYWSATYLNHIESWSNWRRTGYPELTPTNDPNAFEGNFIPRRLRYWEAEIGANPENYAAARSRMGGDLFATRVWWDGGN